MAEGVEPAELLDYFRQARSWDHDRALKARREKQTAYAIAGIASLLALGAIVWHAVAPLRSVEPYVIRVNQASGGVDVVNVVRKTSEITGDEAVSKYFLSTYVRNRESWIAAASDDLFRSVAVLSAPNEQEKLAAERRPENPSSPVNLFKNGETIGVRVTSVAFINRRVAQVHFAKLVRSPGIGPDAATSWIATINFKYVDSPETEADRLYNPLGFQVVSYRADPELGR